MDFSAAQHRAFVDEYVKFGLSRIPGISSMSSETQRETRERLTAEAEELAVGCYVHWQRSIIRLRQNATLIPRSSLRRFNEIVHLMESDETTSDTFDHLISELRETFPRIYSWIDWWIHPWAASMIFPAKSKVPLSLREQVPRTSNPIEARHSLLHRAVGTGKSLIQGIEGLILSMNEAEASHNAIEGWCSAYNVFLHKF